MFLNTPGESARDFRTDNKNMIPLSFVALPMAGITGFVLGYVFKATGMNGRPERARKGKFPLIELRACVCGEDEEFGVVSNGPEYWVHCDSCGKNGPRNESGVKAQNLWNAG